MTLVTKLPPSITWSKSSAVNWIGNRVVGQVGIGRRGRRGDLDRRIEGHRRPARDIGDLQAIDVALVEVVASRHGQLGGQVSPFAVGAGAGLPADLHAVGVKEVDLALGDGEPPPVGGPMPAPPASHGAALYGGRPVAAVPRPRRAAAAIS